MGHEPQRNQESAPGFTRDNSYSWKKKDGRATLRTKASGTGDLRYRQGVATHRYEALSGGALPTIDFNQIESFLAEPIVVDEKGLTAAPRIVAGAQQGEPGATDQGDRAYARGPADAPLLDDQRKEKQYRIFRNATPLKEPWYWRNIGLRSAVHWWCHAGSQRIHPAGQGYGQQFTTDIVPAAIDIISAKKCVLVTAWCPNLSASSPITPRAPLKATWMAALCRSMAAPWSMRRKIRLS